MSQNVVKKPPSGPAGQAAANKKNRGHGEPIPKSSVNPFVALAQIVLVVLVKNKSLTKQHAPAKEIQIFLSDGEL
jgi:hypothetical protein